MEKIKHEFETFKVQRNKDETMKRIFTLTNTFTRKEIQDTFDLLNKLQYDKEINFVVFEVFEILYNSTP